MFRKHKNFLQKEFILFIQYLRQKLVFKETEVSSPLYLCIYIYIYIHIKYIIYIFTTNIYIIYIHTYIHVCICMYIYALTQIYIYMYIYIYVYNICSIYSIIYIWWIYGIAWKHVYFNIFLFFIVDTISILKLVFLTVYCFCLDDYFGGCVVAIIVTVVVVFVFICLFIYFGFLVFYLFIYLSFFLPLRLLYLF